MAVISVTVYGDSVVQGGIAKIADDSFLESETIELWQTLLQGGY